MKLRIVREEKLSSTDREIRVSYFVERRCLFWWERLVHPWLPTQEEAEKYVAEYLKLKGKGRRAVVKEYETK
jgi:hypothetical protein